MCIFEVFTLGLLYSENGVSFKVATPLFSTHHHLQEGYAEA